MVLLSLAAVWPWTAHSGNACKQHGQNTSKEDPVKRPGSSDRQNRRSKPLDLAEIEQISTDEGTKTASNISQRRRLIPGKQQGNYRRGKGRNKHWQRDSKARDRLSQQITDCATQATAISPRAHNSCLTSK